MTDYDFDRFTAEFRRLAAALERYKQTPEEGKQKADAYFHALKRLPIEVVIAKADAWLEKETRMPKPAEWAGQIVRGQAADVPVLTEAEAHEWLRAERLRFEDTPCRCHECQTHGVTESPRRFVPVVDADDREVRGRIGDRIVTRGEWIHGSALMRWYLAREEFYVKARQSGHPTLTTVGR